MRAEDLEVLREDMVAVIAANAFVLLTQSARVPLTSASWRPWARYRGMRLCQSSFLPNTQQLIVAEKLANAE